MDVFNVVVGVFSIIGSISAIFSLGCLIKIGISVNNNGPNSTINTQSQSSIGKGNTNINIGKDNEQ